MPITYSDSRVYISDADFALGDSTETGIDAEVTEAFATPAAGSSFWLKTDSATVKNPNRWWGPADGSLLSTADYDSSFIAAVSGAYGTNTETSGFCGFGRFDAATRPYAIPSGTAAIQCAPFLDLDIFGPHTGIGFFAYNSADASKTFEVAVVLDLSYCGDAETFILDESDVEWRTAHNFGALNSPAVLRPFSDAAGRVSSAGFIFPVSGGPTVALVDAASALSDPFTALAGLSEGASLGGDSALIVYWTGTLAADGDTVGLQIPFFSGQEDYGDDWQVGVLPL